MRQMKVNGKTIKIPESWKEITLERYADSCTARKQYEAVPRRAIGAAIASICGFSEATLFAMEMDEVNQLYDALQFYFTTAPEPKAVQQFELDGQVFIVPTSIGSATFGEFIDMDNEITEHKDDLKQSVAGILAVYCRPMGESYATSTPDELETRYRKRRALFGKLDMETAEGLAGFFLTSTVGSKPIIVQYGRLRVSLISKARTRKNSLLSMAGVQRLCHLQETIFLKKMQSLLSRAMKY